MEIPRLALTIPYFFRTVHYFASVLLNLASHFLGTGCNCGCGLLRICCAGIRCKRIEIMEIEKIPFAAVVATFLTSVS